MFFNFIVVTLWCVEEDKFGDRSGQTATVWILARCYLSQAGPHWSWRYFATFDTWRSPHTNKWLDVFRVLWSGHIENPGHFSCRLVSQKWSTVQSVQVYFWYFATSGTWQSGQRDNLADTRRILPSAFFSLLSLFFLSHVIFWLSYQGDFLKSIDHICRCTK